MRTEGPNRGRVGACAWGCRPRYGLAFALVMLGPSLAGAVGIPLPTTGERKECELVQFGADIANCDAERCSLYGHAFVFCDDLKIWSDEMDIAWTPDRQFNGAEAKGNVLVVDGDRVLTCTNVKVERDGIRGRVDKATIRVKDPRGPGYRVGAEGVPQGTDASVLTGDFEMLSAKRVDVTDGTFTLCDCGDAPPSWRFDAAKIEATLGDRVTVWWPRLYLDLLGLGLRTPPVAPISIPLKKRAWGFLAPSISFYGFPWPTVDLPFFMPVAESWDLTIAPGMRFDWIGAHKIAPGRWGAPRLGGRLRYAPVAGVTGEANVQWTWDRKQYIARQYIKGVEASTGQPFTPEVQKQDAELQRLESLRNRVRVDFKQKAELSDELRWLVDVGWLSDDRIPGDFGFNLEQLVVDYNPSRTQLTWHDPRAAASLSADFLQAIGNDGDPEWEYSNIRGSELHAGHRGPAARFTLLPLALGSGLHLDGDASIVRYGSWHPDDEPTLVVGAAAMGLGFAQRMGPVSVRAQATGHGMWERPAADDDTFLGFAHLRGDVETTLARRYGDSLHTVTPALNYRGIPIRHLAVSDRAPLLPEDPAPCVWRSSARQCDQRLDTRIFHQGSLSLEQFLYAGANGSLQPRGRLLLSAPMDLMTGKMFPLRAESSWWTPIGRGSLWIGVRPDRGSQPLQEVGAEHSVRIRWFTLSADYIRWAPDAERFVRSIYEIASSRTDSEERPWVHSTTGSVAFANDVVSLSYRATVLLRLPEALAGDAENQKRPYINQHVATLSYTSPCHCWSVGATATLLGFGEPAPGTEPVPFSDRFRAQVTLSIGGYALGT